MRRQNILRRDRARLWRLNIRRRGRARLRRLNVVCENGETMKLLERAVPWCPRTIDNPPKFTMLGPSTRNSYEFDEKATVRLHTNLENLKSEEL